MSDITITPAKLRDWGACWYDNDEDGDVVYHEHVGSMDPISLVDALQLDSVPVTNRVWLACHALPDHEVRLFACDCAERALRRLDNPDPRSIIAIETARRYAHGEATLDELSAARDAARDARDAAKAAKAAWAAEAARAAAEAAGAASAAWAAWAAEAAWQAAAEREWQLARAMYYAQQVAQ